MILTCVNCDKTIDTEKFDYEIGASLGEYWCKDCVSMEIQQKFQMADIVRFKPEEEEFGLHEVTGYSADGEITLTNNECNSEFYANENALILVCSAKERKDITI